MPVIPVPRFLSLSSQSFVSSSIKRVLNKGEMLFLLLPVFLLFHNFVSSSPPPPHTSFFFRIVCLGSHLYPQLCDPISWARSSPPLEDPLHGPVPSGPSLWPLVIALQAHGHVLFGYSLTSPMLYTHCSLCLERCCPAPSNDPDCRFLKAALPDLPL